MRDRSRYALVASLSDRIDSLQRISPATSLTLLGASLTTCRARIHGAMLRGLESTREQSMSTIKQSVAHEFAEHIPYHRRLAELEQVAGRLGVSPTNDGVVEMIVSRPAVEERRVLQHGVLDAVHGLRGDNWEARGADTASGRADPLRQITIMNSRVLATVAGARDRWQLAGDQLIVDLDISIDNLPAGTWLQIGEAVAEVTEPPHTGCAKFAGRFGADSLQWANSKVGRQLRRRGMHVRVLVSGTVRAGDAIRPLR
jgi:hypothetical protein